MPSRKDKTVLITGATRGIGQAIALKLGSHGANLIIVSKDSDAAIQETQELLTSHGTPLQMINCDIASIESDTSPIQEAIARFGNLDILINNTSATCFNDAFTLSI